MAHIIGRCYQPLTQDDRAQLFILKRAGKSKADIARCLGRHPSTIGRELRRNSGVRGYFNKQAQQKAVLRRKKARYRKMTPQIVAYIEKRIGDKLSPEQVSNTMRKEIGTRVCHERIYQHIAQSKDSGGTLEVPSWERGTNENTNGLIGSIIQNKREAKKQVPINSSMCKMPSTRDPGKYWDGKAR